MASRRYTIEKVNSDDYEIDGKVYDSVYKYEQALKGKDCIVHEEVYNAATDEWEYTGASYENFKEFRKEGKKYKVFLTYVKDFEVEAESYEEAIKKAHEGDVISEGSLTACPEEDYADEI